ncbi:MAG: DUF1080 domain-containing protein [Verrucomicrobiales bacterium]|nr:DUF1080 domain-containing protein [Verrucomicrobiales bacterium]
MNIRVTCVLAAALIAFLGCAHQHGPAHAGIAAPAPKDSGPEFRPLFPDDGTPTGWVVRNWTDVSQLAPTNTTWAVQDGILRSGIPRGTWLIAEPEYGDFTLEFDFRLGERGHGAVGLRLPASGNPTFDALEIRLVDPAYFGTNYAAPAQELTGALNKWIAPSQTNLFRRADWNRLSVTCKGAQLVADLNQVRILDVDLASKTEAPPRGRPLAERPRRGRIGFQELSRGTAQLEVRNARLKSLD